MSKLLSISEAAKVLGVSESTLRRWEREGRLLPDRRTEGVRNVINYLLFTLK